MTFSADAIGRKGLKHLAGPLGDATRMMRITAEEGASVRDS